MYLASSQGARSIFTTLVLAGDWRGNRHREGSVPPLLGGVSTQAETPLAASVPSPSLPVAGGAPQTPAVILEPKKIKSVTVSIVSSSICHEEMGPDDMFLAFECWVLSQNFHSPLSHSTRDCLVLLFFFFCHKRGIICISEVIDISPDSIAHSLCFLQSGISYYAHCIK